MSFVAFQGYRGAFSHEALRRAFPAIDDGKCLGVYGFRSVFEAIIDGSAVAGVIPIENSLAGSIHENYDHLSHFEVPIVGELYLPIQLCVATLPGTPLNSVKRILSHPKALEQCRGFFEGMPTVDQLVWGDTAGAAKSVAERVVVDAAALCSVEAAQLYGLEILATSIQDHLTNTTRFLVLGARDPNSSEQTTKCSLLFHLSNVPGALLKCLEALASRGANLTKIESRPILDKPFEYRFFVDFEFQGPASIVASILEPLTLVTTYFRAMGIYPTIGNKL